MFWAGFHTVAAISQSSPDSWTTQSYLTELNPDEGIWKHLKYVELKNVCCQSPSALRNELRKAKERLRQKKYVILGCIRQPGLGG